MGRHFKIVIHIMCLSVIAGIAQLVERDLVKVEVAGSNPVSRSNFTVSMLIRLPFYVN